MCGMALRVELVKNLSNFLSDLLALAFHHFVVNFTAFSANKYVGILTFDGSEFLFIFIDLL